MMKMSITITDFPMLLLESMTRELKKHADCEIHQFGADVNICCKEDVVKCMEVIAIADKYNFHMDDDDYQLFASLKSP